MEKNLLNRYNNYQVPESNGNLMISYKLALNELLLNVLRILKFYFQKMVLNVIQNDSYLENLTFTILKYKIQNVFSVIGLDRLCKYFPLILYYLYSSHITDQKVFSLYLSICSDWIQFFNNRCMGHKGKNGKWMYESQCIKQSINKKLMLNYYMITQKAIYDENDVNNFPDLDSLDEIIQNIYKKLESFYKPKKIYLWTSFDWLSSAHIFTKSLDIDDMNDI
jgi:hypothetical protein